MKKETLQVWRDPSCILIAFVLPMILLFIFGYGLSLDAKHVRVGFVSEEQSPLVQSLRRSFQATEYVEPVDFSRREEAREALVNAHIRGIVVLRNDFTQRFHALDGVEVQLITDGVETNTATVLENYVLGIVTQWTAGQMRDRGLDTPVPVEVRSRIYFNPELESRNALIPGSIVLIMAIIGTVLTSMVVAREWERGTMEALLATPIAQSDMLLGKLVPYYVLGMGSTATCTFIAHVLFHVPFRGSVTAMFLASTAFLLPSLALGFLISTVTRNQFLASQLAFMFAFLPNTMLSGAIFEISSMPWPLRALSYIFPSRYYVTCLQSIFMAGDVWPLIWSSIRAMLLIAAVLFVATLLKSPKRLE